MSGMRVNVTVAAKLTGRSEKTIRSWLAEEPSPLSVEWGQYRGGRQMGKTGAKGTVRKGRTRLLDMRELRALHMERGGTEWYAQYEPVPDARELARRVADLEAQLATLRERAPYLFTEDAPAWRSEGRQAARAERLPSSDAVPATPRQRPLSASQRQGRRQGQRKRLPDGWIAVSRWAKEHGLDDRSLRRSPKMPLGQRAPEGDPWYLRGLGQYPVAHAYTLDDQAAAVAAVHEWRATHADDFRYWHECSDPDCPCHTFAHRDTVAGVALDRSEPADE